MRWNVATTEPKPRAAGIVADARRATRRGTGAFTLAELLVVIGIIAILATIGIPALRGLGESNAIDAATRQILDDLAYARQRAINDRTTVYMLFVPGSIELEVTNLAPYRYTGYTLYTRRTVGEQPGRQSPRQIIPWRNLPDKVYFSTNKHNPRYGGTNLFEQPFATNTFALVITNRPYALSLPYLAFNSQGQLVELDLLGRTVPRPDVYIPLVRGSVIHPQDSQGRFIEPADVVEVPPGNRRYIRVNWLTGRAEVVGDLVREADGGERIHGAYE